MTLYCPSCKIDLSKPENTFNVLSIRSMCYTHFVIYISSRTSWKINCSTDINHVISQSPFVTDYPHSYVRTSFVYCSNLPKSWTIGPMGKIKYIRLMIEGCWTHTQYSEGNVGRLQCMTKKSWSQIFTQ